MSVATIAATLSTDPTEYQPSSDGVNMFSYRSFGQLPSGSLLGGFNYFLRLMGVTVLVPPFFSTMVPVPSLRMLI